MFSSTTLASSSVVEFWDLSTTNFSTMPAVGAVVGGKSLPYKLFLLFVFLCMSLCVLLGNVVVIVAALTSVRLRRTHTNLFIINLAISDLMVGGFIIPVAALVEIQRPQAVLHYTICQAWLMSDVLLCTSSIYSLFIISIDRFISIHYPIRYPLIVNKRIARILVTLVWLLSLGLSLPAFLQADNSAGECSIKHSSAGYIVLSGVLSYFLPLFFMLLVYCRIFLTIHRSIGGLTAGLLISNDEGRVIMRVHYGGQMVDRQVEVGTQPHPQQRRMQREAKAARVLGIICGGFVFCWMPFFTVYVASAVHANLKDTTWFSLSFWLGYCNSMFNPLFYYIFSKDFRLSYVRLWHRCKRTLCC